MFKFAGYLLRGALDALPSIMPASQSETHEYLSPEFESYVEQGRVFPYSDDPELGPGQAAVFYHKQDSDVEELDGLFNNVSIRGDHEGLHTRKSASRPVLHHQSSSASLSRRRSQVLAGSHQSDHLGVAWPFQTPDRHARSGSRTRARRPSPVSPYSDSSDSDSESSSSTASVFDEEEALSWETPLSEPDTRSQTVGSSSSRRQIYPSPRTPTRKAGSRRPVEGNSPLSSGNTTARGPGSAKSRGLASTHLAPEAPRVIFPADPFVKAQNKGAPFRRCLNLLRTLVPVSRNKAGYVYGYRHEGHPEYIKIGWTARTVSDRLDAWESKCKSKVIQVFSYEMPCAGGRIEKLVHAELMEHQYRLQGCVCGQEHTEWFRVSEAKAREVVERWQRFSKLNLYDPKSCILDTTWDRMVVEALGQLTYKRLPPDIAEWLEDRLQDYYPTTPKKDRSLPKTDEMGNLVEFFASLSVDDGTKASRKHSSRTRGIEYVLGSGRRAPGF